MTLLNRRPRAISELERSLVGKHYVDTADSGQYIMVVFGVDELMPDYVMVKPLNSNRCWQRRAEEIAVLVAAYEESRVK